MKHDILGDVQLSGGHPNDAVAMVRYGTREIKVGIMCDGERLGRSISPPSSRNLARHFPPR